MNEQSDSVFTIGHSTHSLEALVALLHQHRVTALADIRSTPFSRFNPQFNKAIFERALNSYGIRYVFLGRELGGRSDDPSCYADGRVQYARLARKELFIGGLERVMRCSHEQRIVLLCAEKEPLECHRALLVAPALTERGISVVHILADGRLEPHESTMARLLDLVGTTQEDLFRSKDDLQADALARQEERVAYMNTEAKIDNASGAS